MLWEHNSTIIVMLTRLREMGRVSAPPPQGPSHTWEHTHHLCMALSLHTQPPLSRASDPLLTTCSVLPQTPLKPGALLPHSSLPAHGGRALCPQEKCHQYWPAERSARYQYFVVDPMAEYNMPQYILREFKVTDARVSVERGVHRLA